MDRVVKGLDKLRDWERVLWAWQTLKQRSGLSILALATICKRSPNALLKEMDGTDHVEEFWCDVVNGPMLRCEMEYDYDSSTVLPYEGYGDPPDLSFLYARAWPWPRYRGIRNERGQTSTGLTRQELALCRSAACNGPLFRKQTRTWAQENLD